MATTEASSRRPGRPRRPRPQRRGGLSPLTRYLLVRLALMIPMLWILVTMVFVLMRVIGDPIPAALGGRLGPAQIAERKADAGLDRPILTQYWEYISGLFHGDFGRTLTDNRSVARSWSRTAPPPSSSPSGRCSSRSPSASRWAASPPATATGSPTSCSGSSRSSSTPRPVFFVGLLLKLAFTPFGWPSSGRASIQLRAGPLQTSTRTPHIMIVDAILWGDTGIIVDVLQHAVLPAIALGLLTGGVFLRLVRVNLLQTLRMDYVTAARARGVSERRVMNQHAFRNALVPVVTVMGLQIALLLGGAILTETTFEWKGLGYQLAEYLIRRDFLAVQGIVTLIALIVGATSFLIDVIVAFVDPRVRF